MDRVKEPKMKEVRLATAQSPEADLLTGALADTHLALAGAPGAGAQPSDRADDASPPAPQTCADCGRPPKTRG